MDRIRKCTAVLVMLWYLVSLAGINVHVCSHTGESYVTLLCGGISCERIHGHGQCECESCHHDHSTDDKDGCCHNDSHRLSLTGDEQDGTSRQAVVLQPHVLDEPFLTGHGLVTSVRMPAPGAHIDTDFHIPDILLSQCILKI